MKWSGSQDWIKAARASFNSLLLDYTYTELDKPLESPAKRLRRLSDITSDSNYSEDDDVVLSIDEQFTEYLRDRSYKDSIKDKRHSPIDYWVAKRPHWPQLATLALNIYSIAVMSDEAERVFSVTGAAITPRRRSLKDQKIGHVMCTKAWICSKIIQLNR